MTMNDYEKMVPGREYNPVLMARVCAQHNLFPAKSEDLPEAHALASSLINSDLVALDLMRRIHQASGGAMYVHRENGTMTGTLGLLVLAQVDVDQLRAGQFDGRFIDPDRLPTTAEQFAGTYIWVSAASTKNASRAVVKGGGAMVDNLLWGLPVYSRAATEDGMRALLNFNFAPLPTHDKLLERPAMLGPTGIFGGIPE